MTQGLFFGATNRCEHQWVRAIRALFIMAILFCGASRRGYAQEWMPGPGEGLEHAILPWPLDTTRIILPVTPDSILLTDQAPTATITVTNHESGDGGKPSHVFFGPECEAGEYTYLSHFYTKTLAQLRRLPIDPITAAWRNGGTCAAAWLTGYPRMLHLAPHEQRTFTIRIVPPSTLPNGRYVARLIYAGAGSHYEVDVIYIRTIAPWHGLRWQPTPPTGPGHGSVEATSDMVVLTEHDTATSVTLVNHAATPTAVWLYVDCPWFMVNYASFGQLFSQYEATWHGKIASLALYLGGMPQYLVLAPHERRIVPVMLIPSWDANPVANSVARIVYTEAPVRLAMPSGDTTFTTPQGAITVVYAPTRARLTLAHPTVTVADTFRIACDTFQSPEIGFIATLHAEVDDAHGQPIPSLAPSPFTSPAQWRAGVPWTFDSTVVVWNIYHSIRSLRVENVHPDGEHRPAAPVCFWLPRFAPGHYQLVVQGYTVQDVAHAHPTRTTVPLDIP